MKLQGNIFIILFILTILIGSVLLYSKFKPVSTPFNPQPTTSSPEQTKTFQSKNLKFSVIISEDFEINDTGITVILTNQDGEIQISRNGTPFTSITDYLKDFDSKRNLKVEQENRLTINNLNAASRIEYFTTGQTDRHKIYFILAPDAMYSISTNSQSLFDDLDQIAQSFRYTP